MPYWILVALLVLLALGALVTRGALPWRQGAALLAMAFLTVFAVEAPGRAGRLSRDAVGGAFAMIAVGIVLLATPLDRRRRRSRGGPPQ